MSQPHSLTPHTSCAAMASLNDTVNDSRLSVCVPGKDIELTAESAIRILIGSGGLLWEMGMLMSLFWVSPVDLMGVRMGLGVGGSLGRL